MANNPDTPGSLDDLLHERKHCPKCGHENRLAAKVCSNCGYAFPVTAQTKTAPSDLSPVSPSKTRAKLCPECGTVCHLEAKVCPKCGHRFQTDFSGKPPAISEPPIVQMPSQGIVIPPEPSPPPVLPEPPQLPPAAPPTPSPTPVNVAPPLPDKAEPPAMDQTSGEPAPELTEVDIEALRRRSPDRRRY